MNLSSIPIAPLVQLPDQFGNLAMVTSLWTLVTIGMICIGGCWSVRSVWRHVEILWCWNGLTHIGDGTTWLCRGSLCFGGIKCSYSYLGGWNLSKQGSFVFRGCWNGLSGIGEGEIWSCSGPFSFESVVWPSAVFLGNVVMKYIGYFGTIVYARQDFWISGVELIKLCFLMQKINGQEICNAKIWLLLWRHI